MTVLEAAARIRAWAVLNYTERQIAYHQLLALANELDPEGSGTVPAAPGVTKKEMK